MMCKGFLWSLRRKEQSWFWSVTCLGDVRVEFFKIFNDLNEIDGVAYEAFRRIILTTNPWNMDDGLVKVLINAVCKIKPNKIDTAIVQELQSQRRANHPLPYELFLAIVSRCDFKANQGILNPLCHQTVDEDPFQIELSDSEVGFMLDQTVTNIPHLATLWESPFGTARYRWLHRHHNKIPSIEAAFSATILTSDWRKSTIPETVFKSIVMLLGEPRNSNSTYYGLSFTVTELFFLVSLFTDETVASNWSCLLYLLDHVHVSSSNFEQVIDKRKSKRTLKMFETACKI